MEQAAISNSLITGTRTDLFTAYDVTSDRRCINERGRLVQDVFQDVEFRLKTVYPEAWKLLDYFCIDCVEGEKIKNWPLEWRWIKSFYVKGDSEGFYFHTEVNGKLMFLGKTLSESRDDAEKIQNALARILEV